MYHNVERIAFNTSLAQSANIIAKQHHLAQPNITPPKEAVPMSDKCNGSVDKMPLG